MSAIAGRLSLGLLAATLFVAGCATTPAPLSKAPSAPAPRPAPESPAQSQPTPPASAAETAPAEVPLERKLYALHHRIVPRVLFESEGRAFADLHAAQFDRLRAIIGDYIGADYAKGVRFKVVSAPDIVFITFPEPAQVPQCYHVALVRTGDTFRYLTLEKAEDIMNAGVKTFFCGWTADGTHQNFGPRTYIDMAAFEKEVAAFIEKRP